MGASGRQVSEEECEVVVHPNKMVYTDDKGKRWEIYMPARDVYKGLDHFRKEEWDELAKFPKWGMFLSLLSACRFLFLLLDRCLANAAAGLRRGSTLHGRR